MQDTELFLSLAEIAGVFVGFGALIAIRSGGPSDPVDVAYVGMVVWMGIQVVTASLLPVAISRFDVPSHAVWLSCSLIVLALFFIGDAVVLRLSWERKALLAATPTRTRAKYELAAVPLWLPAIIALVVIVLGVLPDLEPALYFAAVVLLLLMDALILLLMVLGLWHPSVAGASEA
jgi:hypothetical protein